ncbi:MAG: hypothetical protein AAGA43_13550 [Bacteroidota bacterium]
MVFYVDNKIEGKRDFSYEELIDLFRKSGQPYTNLLYGQPFERCFLLAMPGNPEPIHISDKDWSNLWEEFKRQVPNPEYKS